MSEAMGAQPVAELLALLRECEATDEGIIVDRRTGEIGFDSHTVRENVATSLTLDYASGHLAGIDPTDDDLLTANDWTITRSGGSSARVTEANGPMGTDPTTGAGTYDKSATLSLYEDDQAYHHAGWRVNIGTVNGYRYPQLQVKLHSSALSALRDTIAAVDISDRVTIQNLPTNLPPDDVDLIVEGYTERINSVEWEITFNCAPYKPYNVLTLASDTADADSGRLAGDPNAAIRAAIDDNDLSVDFDPNAYRWTTEADDFDPDLKVRLGGEVVEVSAISTTAATFVAAGAASHADNAAVTPAMYAGATANDLILVFAAIRSSGTGTLATPTGYTRLPVWASTDHVQLFAKVHDGSESDPTITPSGGSAGDTVSAHTFGLRNMPITLTDLADAVIASSTVLNSSAADIAYPPVNQKTYAGCVVLLLAWKQDDYTSVAVPSGLTELLEASTTTGSDQSLYSAYQIQTTPALVKGGSLVVTGGAAAISRAAMVALAGGYQTMTIATRSVNGVTKSHAASTTIEVEDPLVLSL